MTTSSLLQKIFEHRGYTESYLYEIEAPGYAPLKDMDALAAELKEIHDNGDKLVVYPDYDMDGVSAGSCGFAGFAELGFNVGLYIPDPSQGYGVRPASITDVLRQHPDCKCIITCDTGIDCDAAAAFCREKGIRFFITDHHKQKSANTDAEIIVDPMRIDETYEHPAICGAFVMYQVLQYYADAFCSPFVQDQIRRLRVFAGFGTVSDVMPLLYENRQVVRDAIDICKFIYGDGTDGAVKTIPGCDIYRRAFWGIYALLKVYEDRGTISDQSSITEEFFGFYLAPSVNAVKRMDGDMTRAFGVFFGNDRVGDMQYLCQLNDQRKQVVASALDSISDMEQPFAPYLYYVNANPGILGLIAQKLEASSGLPTFVLTQDPSNGQYHGSGRSPEWYPCISRLAGKMFIAGHESAFGCGIDDNTQLREVFDFLSQDVPAVKSTLPVQEVESDYTIATDGSGDVGIDISVFMDYLEQVDQYRPFGKGFPMPVGKFVFHNKDVVPVDTKKGGWEVMGRAKQHLKIHFANGFEVVCWNQAHWVQKKDASDTHVVVGFLKFTEFRGVRSVIFDGTLVDGV